MNNVFYIIEEHEGWYQLREKEGHNVMATNSDLDNILNSLFNLVVKCKGSERTFYRKLNRTEYKKPLPELTLLIRKEEFAEVGDTYKELVSKVVDAALKEVKDSTPVNKVRKMASKIKVKPKVEEKQPKRKEQVKNNKVDSIHFKKRPIILIEL